MAKFTTDNQPSNRGRPKGSRNKRTVFSEDLTKEALRQLETALLSGEPWAVQEVIKRTHPALKPVTDENSLDGELLRARIFEISELEERIQAIEEGLKDGR
ncbi:hypothetical protein OAP63_10480 [Vibrio sp.]|nr:hypothetical protein [Vibrio sp.]